LNAAGTFRRRYQRCAGLSAPDHEKIIGVKSSSFIDKIEVL